MRAPAPTWFIVMVLTFGCMAGIGVGLMALAVIS